MPTPPGAATGTDRGPYPHVDWFAAEPEVQTATGVSVPNRLHRAVGREARRRGVAHVDVVLDAISATAGERMDELIARRRSPRVVEDPVFGRRVRSDRRHQEVARRLGIRPTWRQWRLLQAIAEWHGVALTELVTVALEARYRKDTE